MKKIDVKEIVGKAKDIDLSNIDQETIKDYFQERKELAITIALVAGAILGSLFLYSVRSSEMKELKRDIKEVKDRLEPAQELRSMNKKVDKFIESFPESMRDQELLSFITSLAGKYGFQITSLSSIGIDDKSFYQMMTLSLMGVAPDYNSLAKFVYDIEYSDYATRINQINVTPVEDGANNRTSQDQQKYNDSAMNVDIKIAVVTLVNRGDKNRKN